MKRLPPGLITKGVHDDSENCLRGDVFFVALNPTCGSEIRKPRPCGIVASEELNAHLRTFIVAPLVAPLTVAVLLCGVVCGGQKARTNDAHPPLSRTDRCICGLPGLIGTSFTVR